MFQKCIKQQWLPPPFRVSCSRMKETLASWPKFECQTRLGCQCVTSWNSFHLGEQGVSLASAHLFLKIYVFCGWNLLKESLMWLQFGCHVGLICQVCVVFSFRILSECPFPSLIQNQNHFKHLKSKFNVNYFTVEIHRKWGKKGWWVEMNSSMCMSFSIWVIIALHDFLSIVGLSKVLSFLYLP